jgi:hypothetical protein
MKKLVALALVCSFLLTGCVLHKTSVIQARGGEFQGTFWSYAPIKGKDVVLTWIREIFFTNEKDKELPPLYQMYLSEKGAAGTEDPAKKSRHLTNGKKSVYLRKRR